MQEAVEATAEEASKKLNLNLHEKVGAGPPKQEPPLEAELHAYGITPEFADFVRTLNFRWAYLLLLRFAWLVRCLRTSAMPAC